MYDTILVPTDGSDGARTAIDEGVALAAATGAAVHGLYVVDTRDYGTLPDSQLAGIEEGLEAEGRRAAEAVASAAADAGVEATTAVVRGVPHEAIVEYVEDHDVGLVVMGTHGRTGLGRVLLGSVTENVVRNAPVPVHVVRLGADEAAADPPSADGGDADDAPDGADVDDATAVGADDATDDDGEPG